MCEAWKPKRIKIYMNTENNLIWFQIGWKWHNLRLKWYLGFQTKMIFNFPWWKESKMKRSLIYNGLEQFVHYWVMPLWLVSTCRWQTRMTSVNWAVFAVPCLLFLDHNWDQRWRSISLADAANRRNIPPFEFPVTKRKITFSH